MDSPSISCLSEGGVVKEWITPSVILSEGEGHSSIVGDGASVIVTSKVLKMKN